ncbi:hypothetical protein CHUAL_004149 [Chamberlinius hualienensis]
MSTVEVEQQQQQPTHHHSSTVSESNPINGLNSNSSVVLSNSNSTQQQIQLSHHSRQEYLVPTGTSQASQPSPLALLAATCSKIGSAPTSSTPPSSIQSDIIEGGNNPICSATQQIQQGTTTFKIVTTPNNNQLGTAVDVSQLLLAAAQQQQQQHHHHQQGSNTVSTSSFIVATASDGSQTTYKAVSAQNQNTGNGPAGGTSGTSVSSANTTANITYSVIPQVQNITIDGQEAIFIPAGHTPTFQITGNGQTAILTQSPAATGQYFQASPATLGQMGGTISVGQNMTRPSQGVVQTLQLPFNHVQQTTIPIQVPISNANGQTTYQTIHLPLQAIQAALPQLPGLVAASSPGQVTAQLLPRLAPAPIAVSAPGQLITSVPVSSTTSSGNTSTSVSCAGSSDVIVATTAGTQQGSQFAMAATPVGVGQGQVAWWPTGTISFASVGGGLANMRPAGNMVQVQNLNGIPIQGITGIPTNIQMTSAPGSAGGPNGNVGGAGGLQTTQILSGNLSAVNTVTTSTAATSPLSPGQVQTLSQLLTSTQDGSELYHSGTQLQQDPNDPTKWQVIQTTNAVPTTGTITTISPSQSDQLSVTADTTNNTTTEEPTVVRRLRRVACTCPNCKDGERG